jgi:hypothetical protein
VAAEFGLMKTLTALPWLAERSERRLLLIAFWAQQTVTGEDAGGSKEEESPKAVARTNTSGAFFPNRAKRRFFSSTLFGNYMNAYLCKVFIGN